MTSDKIWEEFVKASDGNSTIVHDALREALADSLKQGNKALERRDVIRRIHRLMNSPSQSREQK